MVLFWLQQKFIPKHVCVIMYGIYMNIIWNIIGLSTQPYCAMFKLKINHLLVI